MRMGKAALLDPETASTDLDEEADMRLIGRLIAATLAVAAVVVGVMSVSGRGHFGVAVLLLVAASTCNSIARHFN